MTRRRHLYLTPDEVARLRARGYSARAIAKESGIPYGVVTGMLLHVASRERRKARP